MNVPKRDARYPTGGEITDYNDAGNIQELKYVQVNVNNEFEISRWPVEIHAESVVQKLNLN